MATVNETTWQYMIQDFSPLLTYAGSNNSSQEITLDSAWLQSCPAGGSTQLSGNTICDVQSIHTTSASGASVSLTFYGQSIQLLGTISGSMQYDVNIDGSVSTGVPSSTQLASISNLSLGIHTVSLQTTSSSSGSLFSFQGAVVTVGTGMTAANVTRTAIQDNDLAVQYVSNPSSAWTIQNYDSWGIQHSVSNTSWRQLNANNTGSYSIPFTGNAILVHGFAWSYNPSDYRVSIDNETSPTLYANSSLQNVGNPGYIYTDGVLYVRANLTNETHVLNVDNVNGNGFMGLDYVEIISVTGGSSVPHLPSVSNSSKHKTSVGKIVGPLVGIGVPLLLLVLALVFYKRVRRPDLEEVVEEEEQKPEGRVTPFEIHSTPFSGHGKGSLASGTFVASASASAAPQSTLSGPSSAAGTDVSPVGGRYLNEKAHLTTAPSETGTPDQIRVQELQAELALAREGGGRTNTAELQAMRRDLQQLMQMVERPRMANDDLPPPEYTAPLGTGSAVGSMVDVTAPSHTT